MNVKELIRELNSLPDELKNLPVISNDSWELQIIGVNHDKFDNVIRLSTSSCKIKE
jgi:hypothetical protein